MTERIQEAPERRNYHRVEVRFPLDSVILGNALSGVTQFTTGTLDLSEGGARIRVPEELPLGQRLGLRVHLPDGTHQCGARVLRSSPSSDRAGEFGPWAAVQFIEPGADMRTAIAALITRAEGDARE